MSFPEFEPNKRKLLFFSRGRGRGHALPDIEIVTELAKLRDDVDLRFISYSTGARTLEAAGYKLIDVDLPEQGAAAEMTALAGRLIGWLKPDLVVSHEEFPPMPVAKIFDKPTAFLIDWFIEPDSYAMNCLKFADEILFMQDPGVHEEPRYLQGKVRYLGRMLRQLACAKADRQACREKLGLPLDAFVVGVVPGAYATEQREPIADLLLPAFDAVDRDPKRLVWLASADFELLRARCSDQAGVTILPGLDPPEMLIAAADVIVGKANTGSILEAVSLGSPVVALSAGRDYVADRVLRATRGVRHFARNACSAGDLALALVERAKTSLEPDLGGQETAARIAQLLAARLPI